jgi:hypothetical protein
VEKWRRCIDVKAPQLMIVINLFSKFWQRFGTWQTAQCAGEKDEARRLQPNWRETLRFRAVAASRGRPAHWRNGGAGVPSAISINDIEAQERVLPTPTAFARSNVNLLDPRKIEELCRLGG